MDIKRPFTMKIKTTLLKERYIGAIKTFVLGFLLSRVVMLEGIAPLGVAYTACNHRKQNMTLAYIGAFLGYISISGEYRISKYIAALTIVYALALILGKTFNLAEKPFSYCSATLSIALLTLIELSAGLKKEAVATIAELMLLALGVYVFLNALSERGHKDKANVCRFCMLSAALLSMPNITLWGVTFSPGKIAIMLLVMLSSQKSGVYGGTITGLIAGFLADITAGAVPLYAATFGCAGLIVGSQNKKTPVIFSVIFTVSVMLCNLCLNVKGAFISTTLESIAASVIYLTFRKNSKFLSETPVISEGFRDTQGTRIKNYIRSHLSGMAAAYEELAQAVENDEKTEAVVLENPSEIYTLSFSRLCRSCKFASDCWQKGSSTQTKDFLVKASDGIMKRDLQFGRISLHFLSITADTLKLLLHI
jgi:stage II sporulation protein E